MPLHAQRHPVVEVHAPAPAMAMLEGPVVTARDMLAGSRIRELLAAGFPAQFHFQVELWSQGRWTNDIERRAEYDVKVRYIPLDKVYEVVQMTDGRALSLGRFARVEDAEAAIARPTRAAVTARRISRRQYYQVTLGVEVLSLRDLDEVDRWLRGEIEPAFNGNAGTVVTRGLKTLVARVLGGEKREYEAHTEPFQLP